MEKSLIAELESRKKEITEAEDSYEIITEIVNSYIPVYTTHALEIAMEDLWLAVEEPEIEASNAYECIINNIAAHLHEKAQEWDDNNQ